MVDEFTSNKMFLYGSSFQEDLLQYVEKDQLEIKYGGTLPNIENKYFPPKMAWDLNKFIFNAISINI